jgi:hypothetical protein
MSSSLKSRNSTDVSYASDGINKELSWDGSHSLTHSWSRALLEKLPIVQLLKNFPAFYATRSFITVFTKALHRSLSPARSIQSIPSHRVSLKIHFSIVHSLGLPSGSFLLVFPPISYMQSSSPFMLHALPISSSP